MALSETPGGAAPAAAPAVERIMPAWVAPLYVGGLALVYLGERVLIELEKGHWAVTGLGVAAVVGATALRFSPRFRVGGDRRESEQLQGILALTGLVALAIYGLTTDWGLAKIGLASAENATRERWIGILQVLWTSLLLLSVAPMLMAEAAMFPMRKAQRIESRRVRAAAAAGFTLGLAAVYGALAVYAAAGKDWKADYSYFKTSRPSDSTRKIAEALPEPVQVVAFFPDVNEVKTEVERYLRELASGVPNLQVEVHDRLLVPKLARDLKATSDGVIVLSKGSVNQTLNIGADPKTAKAKLKTLDRDFQEQLMKLTRSHRNAYLTTGHGEVTDSRAGDEGLRSAKAIRTILQKQNYVLKDLGLTQGLGTEIPSDADLVLVLGPTEPLLPEELAALRRYALRGGKLFIALDPDALSTSEVELPPGVEPPSAPSAAPPVASAAPHGSAASRGSAAPVSSAKPPAKKPVPSSSAHPSASAAPTSSAAPAASAVQPAPAPEALPTTPAAMGSLAALDGLAAVVGLTVQPGVLANETQHLARAYNASDNTLIVTNRYSSHASVSTLSRNSQRAPTIFAGAAALERRAGASEKIDFTVRTLPSTFADLNRNYRTDEPTEKRATYNVAAAVSMPAPNAPKPAAPAAPAASATTGKPAENKSGEGEMRAFVVADADAITDLVLSNSIPNQVLFVDAVRWLGGEESFAGEVNSEEDVRIEHTKQKDQIWFYGTIFGAPGLVLGAGLWYSRRARRPRKEAGK